MPDPSAKWILPCAKNSTVLQSLLSSKMQIMNFRCYFKGCILCKFGKDAPQFIALGPSDAWIE